MRNNPQGHNQYYKGGTKGKTPSVPKSIFQRVMDRIAPAKTTTRVNKGTPLNTARWKQEMKKKK